MRIRTTLTLGLLALSLGLSACGSADDGDGVATAGGDGADPSASATLSDQEAAVRFAQCMREHGIDVPDPDPDQEGFRAQLPEGTDPEDARAATEECKQYMPNGGEPPKLDPEVIEKQRQFAQCMRDNGVEEFPDPSEDGGVKIEGDQFDTQSPEFKAAEEACAQFKPEGAGEGPEKVTG